MRSRWSLPSFAVAVTFAFLIVSSVSPTEPASANTLAPADSQPSVAAGAVDPQGYTVTDPAQPAVTRDDFAVSRIRTAPAVGTPDPGSAQAIAYELVLARGWNDGEYECLVALWNRESHWNVYAHNTSSGAYGIPQALPGDKMASVAPDWQTNPTTQIIWGLGYVSGRYGTPCGAWEHSERKGWY